MGVARHRELRRRDLRVIRAATAYAREATVVGELAVVVLDGL